MKNLISLTIRIFNMRINTYSYAGKIHAYNYAYLDNGDGGDSYEDVYAITQTIPGLYSKILFQEIRWGLFYKWEYKIFSAFSDTTKVWWYNQLLETGCSMFEDIANKIEKHINWNMVDWKEFKGQTI